MTHAERLRIHWLARVLARLHRLAHIRQITPDQHARLAAYVLAEYGQD